MIFCAAIILKLLLSPRRFAQQYLLCPSTTNQRRHYEACIVLAHHSYCLQLDRQIGGFRTGSNKRRVLMNVTSEHVTLSLTSSVAIALPTLRHLTHSRSTSSSRCISTQRNEPGGRYLAAPCGTDRAFDPVRCS